MSISLKVARLAGALPQAANIDVAIASTINFSIFII
jgi:hypothetical protein